MAALGADLVAVPGVDPAVALEEDPVAILEEDPVAIPEVDLQDHQTAWIMDVAKKNITIAVSIRRKEEQEKSRGGIADTIQEGNLGVTLEDDLGVILETTAVGNVEATRLILMSWSWYCKKKLKNTKCQKYVALGTWGACREPPRALGGCWSLADVSGGGQLAGRCTLGTD